MALTQYFVASSLDGYIADEHDDLSWLLQFDGEPESADANPYEAFIAEVGALAMGATTYEWILAHDEAPWSYHQPAWVFTHRSLPGVDGADVRFTSAAVSDVHAEMLQEAAGRNVWLVGGGELVGQFLDHDLLDELHVTYAPVVLGAGAPLLPRRRTTPMRLESAVPAPNGTFVHLRYSLR